MSLPVKSRDTVRHLVTVAYCYDHPIRMAATNRSEKYLNGCWPKGVPSVMSLSSKYTHESCVHQFRCVFQMLGSSYCRQFHGLKSELFQYEKVIHIRASLTSVMINVSIWSKCDTGWILTCVVTLLLRQNSCRINSR